MTVRRKTLDLALDRTDHPDAGDILTSSLKVYRVTSARLVDSRVWGNRWALTLEDLGTKAHLEASPVLADGCRYWESGIYQRGETPAQFFGTPYPEVEQ